MSTTTEVQITAVPLVSIAGRSIAIIPDPAAEGHTFYTIDLEDDMLDTRWWEMPSDVRAYADDLAAEITGTRPDVDLWATVATIIEQAAER